MAIYTKKGDEGTTSLVGGQRVSKACARVNAYGDMDELISVLGIIRAYIPEIDSEIRKIQEVLMTASAYVASENDVKTLPTLKDDQVTALEKLIDGMTSQMPPQRAFILPAGPRSASLAHFARTVCRRAERSVVALNDTSEGVSYTARYLNRLSDYLFTLGRFRCYKENVPEDFWIIEK